MTFDDFWERYPRRVAKQAAVKAWKRLKLSEAETVTVCRSAEEHAARWRAAGTEAEFIPHAGTWLNGRRFEDELPAVKARGGQSRRLGPNDPGYYEQIT